MPVVACPKCKTKFKLSSEQLGKAVRCRSCQAKFRTAAPKATDKDRSAKPRTAGKLKGKPEAKTSRKTKPAPPSVKKPKTLEDELFASAPLRPGAPDPLGNFVLEDPGFGDAEISEAKHDDAGESDDDMFADREHLINNPALKGRNSAATKSADKKKSDKRPKKKLMIVLGVAAVLVLALISFAIYYFAFSGAEQTQ